MPNVKQDTKGVFRYRCCKCLSSFWDLKYYYNDSNLICDNCKIKTFVLIPKIDDFILDILVSCEGDLKVFNQFYLFIAYAIMTQTKPMQIETLLVRLKIRLELFKRVPTATNMLLAYNLIEEITLKSFQEGNKDISEEVNKNIERFDKLKNLALGTKFINERQLAFNKSVETFKKLINVTI